MKGKKWFISLLAAACLAASAVGLAACGGTSDADAMRQVYDLYAANTQAKGGEPLTYEEWVSVVEGETSLQGEPGPAGKDGQDGIDGEDGEDGEDGVGIVDVKIEQASGDKSYIVFTFSNGKIVKLNLADPEDRLETAEYTVTVTDNNGQPVKDVWIDINYLDEYWMSSTVATAKTDRNGIAKLYFFDEEYADVTLKAALANPLNIAAITGEEKDPLPHGYALDLGKDEWDMDITSVDFQPGSKAVEFTLKDMRNGLLYNESAPINYKRTYENLPYAQDITETYTPFSARVQRGRYTYLVFEPYVSPGTIEEADMTEDFINPLTGQPYLSSGFSVQEATAAYNDILITNAALAATGIYHVSISASNNSANPRLYLYSGTTTFAPTDPETGIPSEIIHITGKTPAGATAEQAALYTGTDYIEFNMNSETSRTAFGLFATVDANCTITISVERIGDAKERETRTEEVAASVTQKWAEKAQGETLRDMPLNGSLNVVLGGDGFYHVGSENGPTLLVQLNNAMARYADYSLKDIPSHNERGTSVYEFKVDESDLLTVTYDYNPFVQTYSNLANADGVYGVNAEMKEFLDRIGANGLAAAESDREFWWMIPCQYYEPEGGLPLEGNGSETDPYHAILGNNTVHIEENAQEAYLSFTAPADGYYYFDIYELPDLEIEIASGLVSTSQITTNGYYFFYLAGDATATFRLSGMRDITVELGEVTRSLRSTLEYIENQEEPAGTGWKESLAISVSGADAWEVTIDTDDGPGGSYDGVWINFMPMTGAGAGNYEFALTGNAAAKLSYNGLVFTGMDEDIFVLHAEEGTGYHILLSSLEMQTATFLLTITRNDDATPTPVPTPLTEGETGNSVTPKIGEASDPYSFTATEAGNYTITVPEGIIVIMGGEDFLTEGTTATFYLNANQSVVFNFISMDSTDPITVKIVKGGSNPSIQKDGTALQITLIPGMSIAIDLPSGMDTWSKMYTLKAEGRTLSNTVAITVKAYTAGGFSMTPGMELNFGNEFTGDMYEILSGDETYIVITHNATMATPITLTLTEDDFPEW